MNYYEMKGAMSLLMLLQILISSFDVNHMTAPCDMSNEKYLKDTCYAKCSMPSEYDLSTFRLPMYTGSDSASVQFKTYERKTGKSKTKWVKKVDKNCQSTDPDDCVMWCFETFDVEIEKILYLADTSVTEEYSYEYFTDKVLKLQGGHQEWIAAVCQEQITKLMIYQVCYKLSSMGYLQRNQCTGELTVEFIAALNKYQEDQLLPIGGFNLRTMDHMGVPYEL